MRKSNGKAPKRPEKRLVYGKISTLKPHPRQREFFRESDHEVDELAESMQRQGQLVAIEILPSGVIICGHRRVAAAKKLGWEKILCWVRDDLAEAGEEAVERRLIRDNLERRQLSDLEMARCYKYLKENPECADVPDDYQGDFRDFVAERFGKSGRTLDRFLPILDTPAAIWTAYDDELLKQGPAINIATKLDDKMQAKVAKKIEAARKKGGTRKEIKKRIAEIVADYFSGNSRPKETYTIWSRLKKALRTAIQDFDGQASDIGLAIARPDRDLLLNAIKLLRNLRQAGRKNEENASAAIRDFMRDQEAAEDGNTSSG